jgi:aspartokinase/homoserine dehydrogenase 1
VSDTTRYPHGTVRAVVVSAFQGVTDALIALTGQAQRRDQSFRDSFSQLEARHLKTVEGLVPPQHRSSVLASVKVLLNELGELLHGIHLIGECTPRTLDLAMSFGERLSALIVAEAFKAKGTQAGCLDTRSVITTSEQFGNARPVYPATTERINAYFSTHSDLQIVTGFIGATDTGATTTLGRGGSDFTASIVGAALGADEVEIWTDVDGMLTADPRRVSKAFPIPEVTFEEAMELCHFGAKVIYPPTMQPAVDAGIPLVIKNTLNPAASGTRIVSEPTRHPYPITGISSISDVALLRIQGSGMVGVAGIARRFFGALATRSINIILITQASSEHTICCAVEPRAADDAMRVINSEFELEMNAGLIAPLVVEREVAIISVVGENMRRSPGVSGRIFTALGVNGVNVVAIAQGSSELNISAVISSSDETKALNALHDELFLSSSKTVNLWLAGTGLIGSTLLALVTEQTPALKETLGLDVQVRGLANSRWMRLAKGGEAVDLATPLADSDDKLELSQFTHHVLQSNLPHCVFVDCTASDELPTLYEELLERSIAVVTPNKRGLGGSLGLHRRLKSAAARRRAPFLHETCVGAALPVINTLNDLVRSGDRVLRIEAVLSGTLSYIFNTLSSERRFSSVVLDAKRLGYTEPDPRDDLSGTDVARKVLILAREAGLSLEMEELSLKPLLPAEAMKWSLEEFLERLPSLDDTFEDMRAGAAARGERLFFGASIDCEARRAEIALRSVPVDHPFNGLQGSDNIVAFTTGRYTRPLVVQGAGAGAAVTAAGVLADIIRIAR